MSNNLAKKLVVVMNSEKMRLFEAAGIKITKGLETISLEVTEGHTHSKRDGFSHKLSTPSSFLDPHNTAKDIQLTEAAHIANKHLMPMLGENSEYGDVILLSEAKMLGHFRSTADAKIKAKISEEISKDVVKLPTSDIEKAIFGK